MGIVWRSQFHVKRLPTSIIHFLVSALNSRRMRFAAFFLFFLSHAQDEYKPRACERPLWLIFVMWKSCLCTRTHRPIHEWCDHFKAVVEFLFWSVCWIVVKFVCAVVHGDLCAVRWWRNAIPFDAVIIALVMYRHRETVLLHPLWPCHATAMLYNRPEEFNLRHCRSFISFIASFFLSLSVCLVLLGFLRHRSVFNRQHSDRIHTMMNTYDQNIYANELLK